MSEARQDAELADHHDKLATLTTLKARGWSEKLIAELLGDPDKTVPTGTAAAARQSGCGARPEPPPSANVSSCWMRSLEWKSACRYTAWRGS